LREKSHEELWGEGETVHKLARHQKNIRELDARSSLTAIGWANLFDDSFRQKLPDATKTEQLKWFAVCLALSNPLYTFDKTAWFGSALRAREDTNAWTGAYLYFGAPWNMRKIEYFGLLSDVVLDKTMPEDNANIESDQDTDMMDTQVEPDITSVPAKVTPVALPVEPTKDNPSDKKANATKLVGFKTRNFFLSKPKTPPKAMPTNLPTALERKFNTFFKICLPKVQSKDLGEQDTEVIGSFKKLTSLLWNYDPQLLVYPWVDSAVIKPLKKEENYQPTVTD
jgi:hypothetical protein